MLRNYVKIALRYMWKQKGYSIINILGLAIGMASCILILLYVQYELSYDTYHKESDRIYRVSRAWVDQNGETSLHLGPIAPPFGPLFANDFEGIVEESVRFLGGGSPLLVHEDKSIVVDGFMFAEENVFEVFSWEVISGDPKTALTEPYAVVLTETASRAFFDDEDPIGKQLVYNNFGIELPMKVTAVIRDVPDNSHFRFNYLCSFKTVEEFFGVDNLMQNWGSNNYPTYLLLKEGYDYNELQAQLGDFLDRHLEENNGIMPSQRNYLTLWPLTSIHLHSHLDSEVEPNGDILYVRLYTVIAIFTLIIACINFMNLATARSAKRAREVGIRKVMGAYRVSLIRQFISESVIFSLLSLAVALLIVAIVLPEFRNFIQKDITLNLIENQFALLILLGITLFVGIVAGSYPAFYLSNFQPAIILKGSKKAGRGNISLRSILVVFQFTLSIALIISVGIVQDQIDYMRTKSLGFQKDNMYILPMSNEIYNNFESLKTQFEAQPGITEVTMSSRVPSGRLLDSQGATAEIDGEMQPVNLRIADIHVDHDYLDSYEVEFAAGRNFDYELASDSTQAFILNEAAVKAIGWETPEEAIGKKFDYGMRQGGSVIGVVKDFHFESLHQEIAPIVFLVTSGRSNQVSVRISSGSEEEVLDYLREQWAFLRPGFPFTYFTVSDNFDEQYENEDRLATVIQWFSLLAILIACLGLLGLSSFTAEQRIKEIGIRKVMGASVMQIMMLLTRSYTLLVVISFILASSVVWYFAGMWLDSNFAYLTKLRLQTFMIAGILSVLISWITVGFQTMRAALSDPVDSLKYE